MFKIVTFCSTSEAFMFMFNQTTYADWVSTFPTFLLCFSLYYWWLQLDQLPNDVGILLTCRLYLCGIVLNYLLIEIRLRQSRSHVDLPQSPSIVITSMMINYYYFNNNYDNDKDNNDYSIDNWNQITPITMITCWPSQPTRGSTLTAILDLRSWFKFLLNITICTSSPKCPFIAKSPKWRWAQVVGKFGAFSGEGLAARKHFGECARTAGEGEEGLVGKVELFETVGYNFQGLEINWGLYTCTVHI